jgi:hypothetical protein
VTPGCATTDSQCTRQIRQSCSALQLLVYSQSSLLGSEAAGGVELMIITPTPPEPLLDVLAGAVRWPETFFALFACAGRGERSEVAFAAGAASATIALTIEIDFHAFTFVSLLFSSKAPHRHIGRRHSVGEGSAPTTRKSM